MTATARTTARLRRWSVGAALGAAAGVAAVAAAATAHADAQPAPDPTTPLGIAYVDLTKASDVTGAANFSDTPYAFQFGEAANTLTTVQNDGLTWIDSTEEVQAALTKHGGTVADIGSVFFNGLNEQTEAAAAAALSADQAFTSAPSLFTEIGLIGPEYDLVGLEYETSFYDQVANNVADLGFTDLAGHLPL